MESKDVLKRVGVDVSQYESDVVPTIYTAINHYKDLARDNLSSIHYCISGGAPLPVEVKRDFERLTGCVLVEGYGLSETSPVVACNPVEGEN